MTSLAVALGGALGSLARYWLAEWFELIGLTAIPWATVFVNVTGSFLIGLAAAGTLGDGFLPLPPVARSFLLVGFCGGYTTFSSFSLQTVTLAEAGAVGRSLLNVVLSLVLCVAAAWLGYMIGNPFERP